MSILFDRVSIRKFEQKPVAKETIAYLLRAAMAAPSAGNQQPWEFYVVTNPETIRALSQTSPYAGCAADAPVVIVPCYRTQGLMFQAFDQIDTANATENLLLAITEQGLGGVWLAVAPVPDRMEKVEKLLGIGPELHAFAMVALGYPAQTRKQQDRYDEARVHWAE